MGVNLKLWFVRACWNLAKLIIFELLVTYRLHIDGSKDNIDTCCNFLVKLNNAILNLMNLLVFQILWTCFYSHISILSFYFKTYFPFFTLNLNNITLPTKTFNNIWSLFITFFGNEDVFRIMLEEKKCLSVYSIVLCFVELLMIKMQYHFDMNAM